eukprot:1056694-Rhodomonas_salina.1
MFTQEPEVGGCLRYLPSRRTRLTARILRNQWGWYLDEKLEGEHERAGPVDAIEQLIWHRRNRVSSG